MIPVLLLHFGSLELVGFLISSDTLTHIYILIYKDSLLNNEIISLIDSLHQSDLLKIEDTLNIMNIVFHVIHFILQIFYPNLIHLFKLTY